MNTAHRPLISKPEMLDMVCMTYVSVWKLIRAGQFPRAVMIGGRTFWFIDEIEGWLANRPRQAFAEANDYERAEG
ncbi:MAG: AlpA family phage regulatory protein [Rhodospirillaceae bacterium]